MLSCSNTNNSHDLASGLSDGSTDVPHDEPRDGRADELRDAPSDEPHDGMAVPVLRQKRVLADIAGGAPSCP